MATLIEDLKTFTPKSDEEATDYALYRISVGRKPPPHKNVDDISQHLSIVVVDRGPR